VIHNGDSAKSPVGVIIEAKNPSNQNEMQRLRPRKRNRPAGL
jgi:hypothetical protein